MDNRIIPVIQGYIDEALYYNESVGSLSDDYHTFNELYEFRKAYNVALFNEWASKLGLVEHRIMKDNLKYGATHSITFEGQVKYNVHKSWKHYDGELCFGGEWFIVCAKLPSGLISNHYKAADWDLFKIPEVEKSLFEFDGHTGKDVIERLLNL